MPSKKPRINVVLDNLLYDNVRLLAEKDGVSLSAKVKDLIKEALELQEDIFLAELAERRDALLDESTTLNHDETWS
ncbi:MAG: toxin-antitoxin system, antitoxin component [Thermodesulfobacteriota bacterium]|nr:toxin-antitoxin system, antitoxin component [Thermodesulfobacteriota bacterium]